MPDICLVTIIEVPKDERVYCQAPECRHTVYKRIHVIRQDGQVSVLGSECFKKLFGERKRSPQYGSSEGRLLTPEERQLLVTNTERLIEKFAKEDEERIERERLEAEERTRRALEKEAALERQRIVDAERARAEAERLRAWREQQMALRNDALSIQRNRQQANQVRSAQTFSPHDPKFLAALAEVKQEYRAKGLDPEQAGWRGMVMHEAKQRMR